MSFNLTYGLLFEVRLFHNYFLNKGEETFESMSDTDKGKMLQKFNTDAFATITPSLETNTLLKNYKMVFKKTNTGFRVYIKVKETDDIDPFINVPTDLNLTFLITIHDYQFGNYTDLEPVSNQAFFFSNVKPSTEPITFKYIPKTNENVLISNDYLISETTTKALLSVLQSNEKQNVFGIISLTMQGDNSSKNIVNNLGKIINPNFKIHFNNRKTIWKYIKTNSAFEVETSLEKPLTQHGFVEIDPLTDFTTNPPEASDYQYPNPSVKSIQKIGPKTYSQIFI